MPERQHATWGQLLRDAVEKPGQMLGAYTAFHNYSFGNALLALEQCTRRDLQPGPLNTYNAWLERKRQVRKGEKGITLCMPMPFKEAAPTDGVQVDTAETKTCCAFRFRAYWFVLAQTEGEDTPQTTELFGTACKSDITPGEVLQMIEISTAQAPCLFPIQEEKLPLDLPASL